MRHTVSTGSRGVGDPGGGETAPCGEGCENFVKSSTSSAQRITRSIGARADKNLARRERLRRERPINFIDALRGWRTHRVDWHSGWLQGDPSALPFEETVRRRSRQRILASAEAWRRRRKKLIVAWSLVSGRQVVPSAAKGGIPTWHESLMCQRGEGAAWTSDRSCGRLGKRAG